MLRIQTPPSPASTIARVPPRHPDIGAAGRRLIDDHVEDSPVGLLKTAAKVAVASSVHGRVQRRQQARWAAQDQAPAPPQQAYAEPVPPPQAPTAPAQPPDMSDRLAQLKQLGELLSAGVLTQAEFEQQKARILNG
jgi:Short C-terminal domain